MRSGARRAGIAASGLALACAAVACAPAGAQEEARPRAEARPRSLDVIERGSGARALVLLHGFGAPGDDLVPLGEALARRAALRALMPAAPHAWPGGLPGRQWFPRDASTDDVRAATRAIDALLESIAERGTARERVVLAGFSQGAILSVASAATSRRGPPAAIVALSGRLLPGMHRELHRLRDVPVLVSHGRADPIIPFARGEAMARQLEAAGARVTFVPFDGGHEIPPVVVDRVVEFLGALR